MNKPNHTTRTLRQAKRVTMRELDKLWAELVKKRDGYKCAQYTVACFGKLDAHHIVTRKNMATRYLLENGITLCRLHHSNAENFPRSFGEWFDENFNERWGNVFVASRVLSKTGKAYLEEWKNYLEQQKELLK